LAEWSGSEGDTPGKAVAIERGAALQRFGFAHFNFVARGEMLVKGFRAGIGKTHFTYGVYADACCVECMCRVAMQSQAQRKSRRSFHTAGF